MKLGPESRRRVGDNYEYIIFTLLQDFGWQVVNKNFEIEVAKEVRVSKQQGADGTFLYFDPLWNFDVGVYVESKKCKDSKIFKQLLPKWLKHVDDAIHYSNEGLFHHPFVELSTSGQVSVQEGLLSVWIDEDVPESTIQQILTEGIQKYLEGAKTTIDLHATVVMTNLRLLQLQAVIERLWILKGKHQFPDSYRFEYLKKGAFDAPNTMMLANDYLFIRSVEEESHDYHLLAFNLGESSRHQIDHFTSMVIEIFGSLIKDTQDFRVFTWDLSPSEPDKQSLWDAMFCSKIKSKYGLQDGSVSVHGFNPNYLPTKA
ncbi:MAG: hypothetical protein JXI43_05490 [Tissierellales bacterium]|nr:hypothetical protein [Tissierellales bacterium]